MCLRLRFPANTHEFVHTGGNLYVGIIDYFHKYVSNLSKINPQAPQRTPSIPFTAHSIHSIHSALHPFHSSTYFRYNLEKKIESGYKTVSGMISGQNAAPTIINAADYRDRFVRKLDSYFILAPKQGDACQWRLTPPLQLNALKRVDLQVERERTGHAESKDQTAFGHLPIKHYA